MKDVTQEGWDKADKIMANGTSTGPHGIFIKLMKLLGPIIKRQLRNFINSIFQGEEVTDTCKLSRIQRKGRLGY